MSCGSRPGSYHLDDGSRGTAEGTRRRPCPRDDRLVRNERAYCADETAARYNASAPEDTQDNALAYARFPPEQTARYRNGLLPD